MMGKKLNVAGLFAGIGGLERGFELAGHSTQLLCEVEPGAAAVLAEHFSGADLVEDVCDLAELPSSVDAIAAGFPCQNLSQAGDTAGIRGEKSSLIDHVFRLVERSEVQWLVLENVPFMLRLDRGAAMQHIINELGRLGYRWAYRTVDAQAFGLPQRRRRVFVVASKQGDPASVLFADDATPAATGVWERGEAVGFYWTEGNRGVGWAFDAIPTLKGGSSWGVPSAPAVLRRNGSLVTPGIRDAEALQGFRRGWSESAESAVPGRFRWRMVGNAVNVRAARWLGKRLRAPGVFDSRRLGDEVCGAPWPAAACDLGDGARAVHISEWPDKRPSRGIEYYLRGARPLSPRATRGFVARAERAERESRLRFPAGFLDALRRHLGDVTCEVT